MKTYTLRNVGYDANKRGDYPTVSIEAATWQEAVGEVLGHKISFTQSINPLSSIHAAYVPSPTGGYNKIGCVEHIATSES